MRLSQAMRAGFVVTKPTTRSFLWEDWHGSLYACPIGAAVFIERPDVKYPGEIACDVFPELDDMVEHPMYCNTPTAGPMPLFRIITDLVDYWGYSREDVASWVEQKGY